MTDHPRSVLEQCRACGEMFVFDAERAGHLSGVCSACVSADPERLYRDVSESFARAYDDGMCADEPVEPDMAEAFMDDFCDDDNKGAAAGANPAGARKPTEQEQLAKDVATSGLTIPLAEATDRAAGRRQSIPYGPKHLGGSRPGSEPGAPTLIRGGQGETDDDAQAEAVSFTSWCGIMLAAAVSLAVYWAIWRARS